VEKVVVAHREIEEIARCDTRWIGVAFAIPREGSFLRDAQAAQFPVTVGVWAIFVLLFVKLKQGGAAKSKTAS
jgi:hypothetical protein